MNKYIKALNTLMNEYDAYYVGNKYGECTHPKEFEILSTLRGDYVPNALTWIRFHYDCYYKDELDEGNAFEYLKALAERRKDND